MTSASILKTTSGYSNPQNQFEIDILNTGGVTGNHSRIRLCTFLGPGGYNNTTQTNDCGIVFGTNIPPPGIDTVGNSFVIVPHQNNTAGIRILSNGTVSAVNFNATSDYRIKDNVKTLDTSYTCIDLRPVSYTNNQTNKDYLGFIAHEVQEHIPLVVEGEKDAVNEDGSLKLQTVNYSAIIPILVNDIKRLTSEVNELKDKLNKIEDKLSNSS